MNPRLRATEQGKGRGKEDNLTEYMVFVREKKTKSNENDVMKEEGREPWKDLDWWEEKGRGARHTSVTADMSDDGVLSPSKGSSWSGYFKL